MDLLTVANQLVLRSPLLFFGFVMLTEPSTMAPTHRTRLWYGALVGLLFTPYVHLGSYYFAPEVALLVGNLYSYAVSYRARVVLRLDAKDQIGPDTLSFRFKADRQLRFKPGQYLECTLPHEQADNRGHRRYFTIASAPTEPGLELGVKFYPEPSSFKSTMAEMREDDQMFACQLAGDFTLPRDRDQKLAFIAGGIGITPFRSILKYLADTGERRPVVLIYCVKSAKDIVYKDVIDEARRKLGIRVVYVVFDGKLPPRTESVAGVLTAETLRKLVPDYRDRQFYLSGPQGMVRTYEDLLSGAGVKLNRIKTDYFPGFAA
jgi:ferredoxin-NADP reductase